MLREIKNSHLGPVLIPIDTTSPSTINRGAADFVPSTIASAGTGRISVDYRVKAPTNREVCLTLPFQSIGNGAIATPNPIYGQSFEMRTSENSPTATNGRAHGLILQWRSSITDVVTPQLVLGSGGSAMRLSGARVGSDGVLAFGKSDFTSAKTATGAYTITFKREFSSVPYVFATPATATRFVNIVAVTASQVTLTTWDGTPAAADAAFHLYVYGGQGRDEIGRFPKPVMNSQRKPRILGFRIDYSGGVPSYGLGGSDAVGVPTDNGTGDFTITFKTPFRQTPVVGASSEVFGHVVEIISASSTAIRCRTDDAGGGFLDGKAHVMVLGSDDPGEY